MNFTVIFKEKIHSIGLNHSLVSSKHLANCLLKMSLEHSSVTNLVIIAFSNAVIFC